jgi:uncharacterized protein (TIGR03083 family)
MDTAVHCAHLEREGEMLAALVQGADRARTVATCPEWDLAELFRHVGGLYRWSEYLVRERVGAETWRASLPIEYPDDAAAGASWRTWMLSGLHGAVDTFRITAPTTRVWAWGGDQHARFWARRMLFETVVHRCDAELTLQATTTPIDPAVAIDGIDEFFELLPYMARWNPSVHALRDTGRWSLALAAVDTQARWRIKVNDTGVWWERDDRIADARIAGNAHDLLLWLQGRPAPAVTTTGDADVITRWCRATAF